MNPKIVPVTKFEDFEEAMGKMEYRFWVFRGHGDVDWHLEPTLARYYRSHRENIKPVSYYPRELDSIHKFRKSAHLHLRRLPGDEKLLEWLAVMQHFGAPTRLLDFTFSPYAALFFALESSAPEMVYGEKPTREELDSRFRPYEVHAVHLKSVRLHGEKIRGHVGSPDTRDYLIGKGAKQRKIFVGFYEGGWENQRQVAQQGLFLVPSTIDMDIEHYLKSCQSTSKDFPGYSWIRFQFPGGRKSYSDMVKRLLRANVTAETLFPGLEGVARSVSMGYYAPKINLP